MLAAHQVQVQQPPGMSLLRKYRTREARTAPATAHVTTDPLRKRYGLDALLHGTTTIRIGPGLAGQPRQVTPAVFSSTWPGLNVELKHLATVKPHRRRRHGGQRREEREMGRSGQNFDDVMLPFLGAADSAADAQPKRRFREESAVAVLGAEDQLSAENTPEISRAASRSSVQTRSSAYTSASTYATSTASAIPRRIMLNGTLFFDHRFDASGAAVKGEDGKFRTSPFNSIRKLRRTPTEEKEMMSIIRICAEQQGGSGRKTEKNPEYYPQPLSPTSRFDPPVRMPEKRLPLGVYPP